MSAHQIKRDRDSIPMAGEDGGEIEISLVLIAELQNTKERNMDKNTRAKKDQEALTSKKRERAEAGSSRLNKEDTGIG